MRVEHISKMLPLSAFRNTRSAVLRSALAIGLLVVLLPLACSRGDRAERKREILRAPKPAPVAQPASKSSLYDDKGFLLPSDEAVAGLRLPRGLKLRRTFFRRWVYETRVPIAKLNIYFAPLLYGGELTSRNKRIAYESARLRADRTGLMRLDLTLRPLPTDERFNLVDIREIPHQVRSKEPTLEAVRKQAAHQRRFAH